MPHVSPVSMGEQASACVVASSCQRYLRLELGLSNLRLLARLLGWKRLLPKCPACNVEWELLQRRHVIASDASYVSTELASRDAVAFDFPHSGLLCCQRIRPKHG
jgi:hypothetical protein